MQVLNIFFEILNSDYRAAKLAGKDGFVMLTDGDAEAISIAQENTVRNNVENNSECRLLYWNTDCSPNVDILRRRAPESLNVNDCKFDMIIASDCLYSNGPDLTGLAFFSTASAYLKKIEPSRLQGNEYNPGCQGDNAAWQETCMPEAGRRVEGGDGMGDGNNAGTSTSVDLEEGNASLPKPTGNGGGWDNNTMEAKEKQTSLQLEPLEPVLVVGYHRRLGRGQCGIAANLETASAMGFDWCVADNLFVDLFGNETEGQTIFWEKCIFLFTWKKGISFTSVSVLEKYK